jgi:hypothetical protein
MDAMSNLQHYVPAIIIGIISIIAICTVALLIPLNSVPAISGVSIIFGLAYALSFLGWLIAVSFYKNKPEELTWLNTHLMFLVFFPTTIAATTMNVVSIQNASNNIS